MDADDTRYTIVGVLETDNSHLPFGGYKAKHYQYCQKWCEVCQQDLQRLPGHIWKTLCTGGVMGVYSYNPIGSLVFKYIIWILSLPGDNVVIGSYDCRLAWFDLDVSTKPYQMLRSVLNTCVMVTAEVTNRQYYFEYK